MSLDGDHEVESKSHKDPVSLTKGIIKLFERLSNKRTSEGELWEALLWWLYQLEKALADQRSATPSHRTERKSGAPGAPAPTVQRFQLEETQDGKFIAIFDSAQQVKLTPALKDLIKILAEDLGESPDDLVAWKSFDQLSEWLGKRLGHKCQRHTVSERLLRLRKALAAGDLDRKLLESDPKQGARLRLKRRPPAAVVAG